MTIRELVIFLASALASLLVAWACVDLPDMPAVVVGFEDR